MTQLEKDLTMIYRSLLNKEFVASNVASSAHPDNRLSVMNLIRYITLRTSDLRNIHDHLSELGISSLRSCESYVMHNVICALALVKSINGVQWKPDQDLELIGFKASKKLMKKKTKLLFPSKKQNPRRTKIMVTLPTESAYDSNLIKNLLIHGMDVARINLSHGNLSEWEAMVNHVKSNAKELDLECNIYMDLSGPKIRTENINVIGISGESSDKLPIRVGDHLILTTDTNFKNTTAYNGNGEQSEIPRVAVSLPSIISDTQIGDRIFFDDGMLESKVIKKRDNEIEVIILKTGKNSFKLKSEKGINLPDTKLNLPSLTDADIANMPFVMKHADILGYSFVRTVEDIKALHKQIDIYDRQDIGVVLKIENQESFENLPNLLIEAMKKPKVGVMIARGDLAVEIGPVRIAEVQDEIMWICEAAHVPVIWATQVLENLAKSGKATRAEITDAATSVKAECVMLNKGPYIDEAVEMLSNILIKMEKHTFKKKSTLRALNVSMMNIDKIGNV